MAGILHHQSGCSIALLWYSLVPGRIAAEFSEERRVKWMRLGFDETNINVIKIGIDQTGVIRRKGELPNEGMELLRKLSEEWEG